jgi:hypothetical protein
MLKYRDILKLEPYDERHLSRYLKFLDFCNHYNKKRGYEDVYVAHHICPRQMFPQYASFKHFPWNKILLTERQHFLAHIMLWKAYKNKSMAFAANMLSNFMGVRYTSRLYEECRKEFRKNISECNKGKRRNSEEKERMSERLKDTVIVYDALSEERYNFRISKNDENYDPTRHKFYRNGYKQDENTKMKIGRKGKISCYNPQTGELKYVMDEKSIPIDFERGYPSGLKTGKMSKGKKWYHQMDTKRNRRFYDGEAPIDYVAGRYFATNKGFLKANSLFTVVDLLERNIKKVQVIDRKIHAPESGKSAECSLIYIFDRKIFSSFKSLSSYGKSIGVFFNDREKSDINYKNNMVKSPHHNCSVDENKFREINAGKTYSSLGLDIFKLKEFDMPKYEGLEIVW